MKNIHQYFHGIIDSTLREGLQFHSANYTLEDQITIITLLNNLNVEYIELPNPSCHRLNDDLQKIISLFPNTKFLAHIRNHPSDFHVASQLHLAGINILCTADLDRLASMKKTLQMYLQTLAQNIKQAQSKSLQVRVSVEDYFNQPTQISQHIIEFADSLGVDRIGIADTLGGAMPWNIQQKVTELRKAISADIEVHVHNDLSQATSNALLALQSGANWINTTLLGVGERTGITSLSSLLCSLHVIDPSLTSKYRLTNLTYAEQTMADILGISIPFNMISNPQTGFTHKAGIHLDAIKKHGTQKYELFSPHLIGHQGRRFIVGSPISGKTQLNQLPLTTTS